MSADTQHFTGTDQYIATDSLKLAVKAARALQKPLLVKGEQVQVKHYLRNKLQKV
jgi:MoxR-like ATPase